MIQNLLTEYLFSMNLLSGRKKKKKMVASWKESYDKPRQCIEKQRHHLASKGLYSQGCGFSSNHVSVWELDHKEG